MTDFAHAPGRSTSTHTSVLTEWRAATNTPRLDVELVNGGSIAHYLHYLHGNEAGGEGTGMERQETQWNSVLTERPTSTREPMDTTILLWAMAIGFAVLVGVVVFRYLGRPAKCFRCASPIIIRDDAARVCVPCGGMNRRR